MGEYWASGLKCLSCEGIGDLTELIKRYPKGGVLLEKIDESEEKYKESVENVLNIQVSKKTLREYSMEYFDLSMGSQKYKEIYNKQLN